VRCYGQMGTDTRRAVFLDRDGVINENRPDHVKSLSEFVILPGAIEGIRLLATLGMPVVVVSNQSAINRRLVTFETLAAITVHLIECIRSEGGRIDAVYYCPHRPDEACDCRKPRPGLFCQAARQLGIRLSGSYLIGDALSDVDAALTVGATPILVLTGRGRVALAASNGRMSPSVQVCEDLLAAARWICEREELARSARVATTA